MSHDRADRERTSARNAQAAPTADPSGHPDRGQDSIREQELERRLPAASTTAFRHRVERREPIERAGNVACAALPIKKSSTCERSASSNRVKARCVRMQIPSSAIRRRSACAGLSSKRVEPRSRSRLLAWVGARETIAVTRRRTGTSTGRVGELRRRMRNVSVGSHPPLRHQRVADRTRPVLPNKAEAEQDGEQSRLA